MSAWHEMYGNAPVGTKELHEIALPDEGEPLLKLPGMGKVGIQGQKIRLGAWILRNARRHFFGPDMAYLTIVPAGLYRRARRYRLEISVAAAPSQPSAPEPEPQVRPEPCPHCAAVVGAVGENGRCLDDRACAERWEVARAAQTDVAREAEGEKQAGLDSMPRSHH